MQKMSNPKAKAQFSRFAYTYNRYNIIQTEVAKELVSNLPLNKYGCILDLGCGSGAMYKNLKKESIIFDTFIAVDFSAEMLKLHPTNPIVTKFYADFNDSTIYDTLHLNKEEAIIFSSSALQWSKNLDFTFNMLSKQTKKAYFAIFTSKTFHTLHKTANINSPIHSSDVLKKNIEKHYSAKFELKEYRLEFTHVRDMFRYIKESGVSGGEKQLSYMQMKKLMQTYPLNYLEFEVLFVEATSLA